MRVKLLNERRDRSNLGLSSSKMLDHPKDHFVLLVFQVLRMTLHDQSCQMQCWVLLNKSLAEY